MKSIIKYNTLIIILLLFTSKPMFSCSCAGYNDVFCQSFNANSILIQATVNNHISGSLMEIIVIENLHNSVSADTIFIEGHDGANCGEELSKFQIGDTLIMAIYDSYITPNTYSLPGLCGIHYLNFNSGKVIGNIFGTEESVNYEDFKSSIMDCQDFKVFNRDFDEQDLILVYPNPVYDAVYIQSYTIELQELNIYNTNGVKVLTQNVNHETIEISLHNLNSGIYFIQLKNKQNTITKQFVKL